MSPRCDTCPHPSHPPSLDHPINIWRSVQLMDLLFTVQKSNFNKCLQTASLQEKCTHYRTVQRSLFLFFLSEFRQHSLHDSAFTYTWQQIIQLCLEPDLNPRPKVGSSLFPTETSLRAVIFILNRRYLHKVHEMNAQWRGCFAYLPSISETTQGAVINSGIAPTKSANGLNCGT